MAILRAATLCKESRGRDGMGKAANIEGICELTKKLRSYHPTSGYSTTMRKAADEIDGLREILKSILLWADDDRDYPTKTSGAEPVVELHWYGRRMMLIRNAVINALRRSGDVREKQDD